MERRGNLTKRFNGGGKTFNSEICLM
jgi:hypothetical protein